MSAANDLPPPPGMGALPAAGSPGRQQPPPGPSIATIQKRALAHWWVTLIVLALGISVTLVLSRSRKPTYLSETTIEYKQGINRDFVGVEGEEDLKKLPGRLKETLLSRNYLERVVKEYNLYPNIVAAEGYLAAVDRMRQKIGFKPKSAEVFLITFEGTTPEEAQGVTARLADILIEDQAEGKRRMARDAREYLDAQRKKAEEELEKRVSALAKFIAVHPEFALEANAEQPGAGVRVEQKRAGDDPALLALERQAPRLKAALAIAKGGAAPAANGAPAGPGLDPKLVQIQQQAEQEQAAARRELTEKQEKFTDSHPDVAAAKKRVAQADAAMRRATTQVETAKKQLEQASKPRPASEDDPYEGPDAATRLQRELKQVEQEIQDRKSGVKTPGGAEALVSGIIAVETEWAKLLREKNMAQTEMNAIVQRQFNAEMNESSEKGGYSETIRVLDQAFMPTESGTMPKGKFIGIGIAVSLLLGIAFAAAYGLLMDDRVYVAEDLVAFAPVLGTIPRGATPPKRGARG